MNATSQLLTHLIHQLRPARLRARLSSLRTGDEGYSTEAVIVIALLVAMAIAAVAIISTKVLAKAHGISTG
jgi:hypothetical protein